MRWSNRHPAMCGRFIRSANFGVGFTTQWRWRDESCHSRSGPRTRGALGGEFGSEGRNHRGVAASGRGPQGAYHSWQTTLLLHQRQRATQKKQMVTGSSTRPGLNSTQIREFVQGRSSMRLSGKKQVAILCPSIDGFTHLLNASGGIYFTVADRKHRRHRKNLAYKAQSVDLVAWIIPKDV